MDFTQRLMLESVAFLGTLLLFIVLFLSTLSALSKMPVSSPKMAESRRSWEMACLVLLATVLITVILIWRVG